MSQIVINVPSPDSTATIIGALEAALLSAYPVVTGLNGKQPTMVDYICILLAILAGVRGYITNKQPKQAKETP